MMYILHNCLNYKVSQFNNSHVNLWYIFLTMPWTLRGARVSEGDEWVKSVVCGGYSLGKVRLPPGSRIPRWRALGSGASQRPGVVCSRHFEECYRSQWAHCSHCPRSWLEVNPHLVSHSLSPLRHPRLRTRWRRERHSGIHQTYCSGGDNLTFAFKSQSNTMNELMWMARGCLLFGRPFREIVKVLQGSIHENTQRKDVLVSIAWEFRMHFKCRL